MSNENKAFKAGVWYVVGNFLAKAAGFITTPFFTRILTKSEIGNFANLTSWIEIFAVVFTLNLTSSVMIARFDYGEELDDYISSNLILGSLVTLVVYSVVVINKSFFISLLNLSEYEIHVIFMYLAVYPALQMYLIKSRIKYEYRNAVMISLVATIASTILSLVCAVIFSDKLLGRVIGYYGILFVINLAIYISILLKARRIKCSYWKYALAISLPLIWHALAGNILGSSDRVMITHYCGDEATAYYSIAYYCGLMLSVFWSAINNAWSTWAYEKMDEQNIYQLKSASKPLLLLMGGIIFIILLFAPEILLLMGGKSYMEAVYVIPPVVIAYAFQVVYSLYVNVEFFYKKQKYIAIGTTIAAIVNIVLNVIFIPAFGYIAAAYTTLAGYILLFFIHFYFVFRMKKSDWYDIKFNLIFLGVSLLLLPLSTLLYKFFVVRVCAILILGISILVTAFLLRREINKSIKSRSIKPLKAVIKTLREEN